jgi:adenylate cyclase
MEGLLFIDDEEGVRRSVTRALSREPYEIFTAEDGQKGVSFVARDPARVGTVISDYKMPFMDGLETLTRIGSMNPEITRIILTGYATMDAAISATNEGVDGFLTKPFDNIELRAQIREINVRKRLRQFVAEPIYRAIEKSPSFLKPRNSEVTILFSDIRGFTAMAEKVSPGELADFLNHRYFIPMGEIAYGFGGTVDKHIGDSIMVVFGVPVAEGDDTLRAVRAAVAMQEKAGRIDGELDGCGALRLHIGIGVASGGVFSGVLGSLRKKEYTCIGRAVNVAARLTAMAGPGEILISQSVYEKVAETIPADPMPQAPVKGLPGPITVFRVCDRFPDPTAVSNPCPGSVPKRNHASLD